MSSKIASGSFPFNAEHEVPGLHLIVNNTVLAAARGHGRAALGLARAGPESAASEPEPVPALTFHQPVDAHREFIETNEPDADWRVRQIY